LQWIDRQSSLFFLAPQSHDWWRIPKERRMRVLIAERERVDEVIMGVGRHPEWLRWFNPSISRGVMARTDIPVTVLNRGHVEVNLNLKDLTPC
jgi:hypothetical protein